MQYVYITMVSTLLLAITIFSIWVVNHLHGVDVSLEQSKMKNRVLTLTLCLKNAIEKYRGELRELSNVPIVTLMEPANAPFFVVDKLHKRDAQYRAYYQFYAVRDIKHSPNQHIDFRDIFPDEYKMFYMHLCDTPHPTFSSAFNELLTIGLNDCRRIGVPKNFLSKQGVLMIFEYDFHVIYIKVDVFPEFVSDGLPYAKQQLV